MSDNVIKSSFIAGGVQTILGHPLDTIKTRIQIYNTGYKNTIYNLYKKEGIRSFYKGGLFPFISGCSQNCFIFSTEDYLQNYFNNHIYTGFISGSISSIITSPAELIKCQIQQEKSSHLKIKNVISIMKKKNIVLSTGLSSTFIRDSIGFSIYFGSYNYFQDKYNNPLINGGLAGMMSWIYSYPIDVIKTHKQIYNLPYKTIINNIQINKYIKGIDIVLIRSFVVNAGIFYLYEKMK
jgi:hypothetical protein